MSTTEYKFKVDVPCMGCVNAIKRSLDKTYGADLKSVDADLTTKLMTINIERAGEPYSYDHVYEALVKTGKTVAKLEN